MPATLLLRARLVLPVNAPPIEDGAVLVDGPRVAAVGRWADLQSSGAFESVDLGERLLMPGLVNAHCHLDYTEMAGLLPPPRFFPDWIKQIITIKSEWSGEDYTQSWITGADQLVRSGVTTVMDIESRPDLLPHVWPRTPLRVISCAELISVRRIDPVDELVSTAAVRLSALTDPIKRVGLSPHAPYSTSADLLSRSALAARSRGWPVTMHVAESAEEFEMFMYRRGPMFEWLKSQRSMDDCGLGSPVRHVEAAGLLGPQCVAVHVNYLWDGDAEILGKSGTSVVHCPRSHEFFQHHRFPIDRLEAAGVNICLGTDSLASMASRRGEPLALNLFSEMRTFAARAPMVSPEKIVRLGTINGARAVGLAGQAGEIAPGTRADLIALPFPGGSSDPWETVLGHRGDVAASMIDGRWIMPPASTAG